MPPQEKLCNKKEKRDCRSMGLLFFFGWIFLFSKISWIFNLFSKSRLSSSKTPKSKKTLQKIFRTLLQQTKRVLRTLLQLQTSTLTNKQKKQKQTNKQITNTQTPTHRNNKQKTNKNGHKQHKNKQIKNKHKQTHTNKHPQNKNNVPKQPLHTKTRSARSSTPIDHDQPPNGSFVARGGLVSPERWHVQGVAGGQAEATEVVAWGCEVEPPKVLKGSKGGLQWKKE